MSTFLLQCAVLETEKMRKPWNHESTNLSLNISLFRASQRTHTPEDSTSLAAASTIRSTRPVEFSAEGSLFCFNKYNSNVIVQSSIFIDLLVKLDLNLFSLCFNLRIFNKARVHRPLQAQTPKSYYESLEAGIPWQILAACQICHGFQGPFESSQDERLTQDVVRWSWVMDFENLWKHGDSKHSLPAFFGTFSESLVSVVLDTLGASQSGSDVASPLRHNETTSKAADFTQVECWEMATASYSWIQ